MIGRAVAALPALTGAPQQVILRAAMKPRDAFAVAVRVIGLLGLLFSANILLSGFVNTYVAIRAVISILISLWLLRGAPQIVRFAYRDDE